MGKIVGNFIMPHPPIMIPEIGRGEDEKINATKGACLKIAKEIQNLRPDTIIVITPHGPVFRDAVAISKTDNISGNFKAFGISGLNFEKRINEALTDEIISNADESGVPIVPITANSMREYNVKCELEHGSMVPLYYIDKQFVDYDLVHITYGAISSALLYRLGMSIRRAVEDEGNEFKAVIIASGDLSHRLSDKGPYEYDPKGPEFDKRIIELLAQGDVNGVFNLDKELVEGAGECGLRSFYILLGTMEGYEISGELLSYEGTFGVGYGVMRFDLKKGYNIFKINDFIEKRRSIERKNRENESVYVKLARESLEYYLKNREYMKVPKYATEEMKKERRGAFVSLKKEGELRGCIGTILPTTNSVALEIIRNAVEAGEHDLRFYPVELEELEDITFSVDVLMPPVPASKEELDPKKYGVIVSMDGRRGLLLPDLEGVDTVEQQLSIALSKGGISPNENYTIEKFEVIRHR